MKRTLLITGGTGYLGAELVRLARDTWHVVATHLTQPPETADVTWQTLDLREPTAVANLIATVQPAAVIHTAYVQGGLDLAAITALGAGHVAAAARAAGAQLIHLSSDAIWDGTKGSAYTEADAPSPITSYGAAKAAAEQHVADAHPGAVIARTSLIYGGARLSKYEQLALAAAAGSDTTAFFTDEIRCPVQVTDLAHALLAALKPAAAAQLGAGVLHVGGAEAVSRARFAQQIAAAHGADPVRLRQARSADQPVRRPLDCRMQSDRARAVLGIELRGVSAVLTPTTTERTQLWT